MYFHVNQGQIKVEFSETWMAIPESEPQSTVPTFSVVDGSGAHIHPGIPNRDEGRIQPKTSEVVDKLLE